MVSPVTSDPLKFKPAKDPVVWTFVGLLAFTLFFAMFGAYQNNRIADELRNMVKYQHEQLDYLRDVIARREAELQQQRMKGQVDR